MPIAANGNLINKTYAKLGVRSAIRYAPRANAIQV
jgi:hypothetical protein